MKRNNFLNKKAQGLKSKIPSTALFTRKAQEEMIGFALIIIFVAVIFLVFISLSLNKNPENNVENYEAESFLQGVLDYTTDCEDYLGPIEIRDLIFDCNQEKICLNGENSCDVLEETIENILKESWTISKESPYKGYNFYIVVQNKELLRFSEGNKTNNAQTPSQDFSKKGDFDNIIFEIYS